SVLIITNRGSFVNNRIATTVCEVKIQTRYQYFAANQAFLSLLARRWLLRYLKKQYSSVLPLWAQHTLFRQGLPSQSSCAPQALDIHRFQSTCFRVLNSGFRAAVSRFPAAYGQFLFANHNL